MHRIVIEPASTAAAPRQELVNVPRLVASFFLDRPDPAEPGQAVSFGTSGHRGSSLDVAFNELHIVAITAAIVEHRRERGIDGPLFLGMDTHALSEPARAVALEVLAGSAVEVVVDERLGYTPTPVISHAILARNRGRRSGLSDGIVITPSHNPPNDGGFKYNPPNGGPADTAITRAIQERANQLLQGGVSGVRRIPLRQALRASSTHARDLIGPYVADLGSVLRMDEIARAGVRIGVDPLGGASAPYWEPIAEMYGLDLEVANESIDPTYSFMPPDWDGKIRMDCSSPDAMAGLIGMKDRFQVAFGSDPDGDRHGIVTPAAGLLNPNHYLAVAIDYLFRNRSGWSSAAAVGKTLVSSSMIDRVAADLGRTVLEVPVGFKWFVDGLLAGTLGFGGEESAGASFLRQDGSCWTTDKDGIILGLLAAEITAVTGRDPGEHYAALTEKFGSPAYERIDAAASPEQKQALGSLTPDQIRGDELAGERILQKLTAAPGNGAPIGGLKVVTENGWFAARPSGTENVYKIYAESFLGADHLTRIQQEAREIVNEAFTAAGIA